MPKLQRAHAVTGVIAALLLASCGGGGGDSGAIIIGPGGGGGGTGRGSLVSSPPPRTSSFTADEFKALLNLSTSGKALEQVAGAPRCGVEVRSVEYRTVGAKGEATNATAALMLPTGSGAPCSGAKPIVLYAHGTSPARNYNLADFANPSQPAAFEGQIVAAMFAAQGYIVVAPNYAGYDKSTLPYHPYLNGDQQGKDMVDALAAARTALPSVSATDGGALLVTGYSQGGYVALAAQRELQSSGKTVTAAAALSAPSAISLMLDYSFSGWPTLGATVFTTMLIESWQQQFGNVYSATGDIFEAQYANGIDTLLPSLTPINDLLATRKLPPLAMYPANATPGPVSPALAIFYGAGTLIKQSYLTQGANDIAANPCAGNALPATATSLSTAAPLDCKPGLMLRQAAVANDLRNWLPVRPLLMCGGALDPTVNFLSTRATAGYFRARGMPAAALAVLDLEEAGGASDPFAAARAGFATAKANLFASTAGTPDVKASAVTQAYHGALVAPFCLASARGFFESVRASGS